MTLLTEVASSHTAFVVAQMRDIQIIIDGAMRMFVGDTMSKFLVLAERNLEGIGRLVLNKSIAMLESVARVNTEPVRNLCDITLNTSPSVVEFLFMSERLLRHILMRDYRENCSSFID